MGLSTTICFCMAILSVASVNINGMRNDLKRTVLFEYLHRRKFDVIFLQETHTEENDELVWSKQWKGKFYFSHGNRQSKGVAMLINYNSGLDVTNIEKDDEGRWIKGEIKWENTCLNIASVYAPNEAYARAIFFDKLVDCIDNDNDWIVGGDLNCNMDNDKGRDASKSILKSVLHEKDLVDVWRTICPDDSGCTPYHKASMQPSRFDYLFISSNVMNNISEVGVSPWGLSDHCVVSMKLDNPSTFRGQGRWICNNIVLKDYNCNFRIEAFWKFWRDMKGNFDSLAEWWEMGKFRIKEIIEEYSREKAKKKFQHRSELQKRYNHLISNPNEGNLDDLKTIETEMKSSLFIYFGLKKISIQ